MSLIEPARLGELCKGIALARKEGIAMAAEAIARLKGENDACRRWYTFR
jgi:hypothetical protein